MKKYLSIFVVAFAALALMSQSADARQRHHKVDKRIKTVALVTGVASGVTMLAINNWRWNRWSNSSGLSRFGAWGVTTIGCAVVSPMVATMVVKRPLTQREAHVLVGSCIVPVVGGWLVNRAYDRHPEWEPRRKHKHRH